MSREEYIKSGIDKILYSWLNMMLFSGTFLILSLSLLDYYATPSNFVTFLVYRIFTAIGILILYLINRIKINSILQNSVLIVSGIIPASMVAMMVSKFDGHQSPYFAGFIIVIVYLLSFTPINLKVSMLVSAVIYGFYVVPILVYDNISNPSYFVAANGLILAIIFITVLSRYISQQKLIRELSLKYDLEQQKGQLEKYSHQLENMVAQRTKELTASEQRFRGLFDNANDGIVVLDTNGIIQKINNKFCELHGFEKNVLIGTHFRLLEAKDSDNAKEERMKRIVDGEPLVYETEHYKKDGNRILLEVSSKAINIGGELYIQSFHRDITEKKQMQEQLFQSQKMESIGTLAGGIAHDFNNILTAILGHTELLHYCEGLDNKAKQSLRIIENSSRKAGQIVSGLLSFSRRTSFEMLPVNLNNIIKDTVELCETTSSKRNVKLKMDVNNNIPFVHADCNHLEQVLMNLFVNAMDAMPNGGSITITTELVNLGKAANHLRPLLNPGSYVVMKVTDTGTGIPDEIRDKIFNPFFTTKEPGKGTGLGLAMVYGIIKEHKGIVNVKSALGKGTTFELYLPATDAAIRESAKTSASSATRNIRILVVDDEEGILNFIKEVLEKEGYRLIVTSNPHYAVEMFSEFANNIDLIITDIVMPMLDGKRLIKHFKAIKPTIKTIAISAHDAHISRDKNIDTFIKKPFEGADLLSSIRKVLGSESSTLKMN
ncbi:MAG: PAS domain S-box protein [Deltaproteobacteria bacterium]|nr:PAS domain S-box protein [Deltaproteobacteria bacterium]